MSGSCEPFLNGRASKLIPMVVVLERKPVVFATPPGSLAGWNTLVAEGGLATLANSDVLAAIDLWKAHDKTLCAALYVHLVQMVAKILRRQIGRHLVDKGLPAIERAAALIANAIRDPTHRHGVWIRKNFSRFVRWRTLTILKEWRREVEGSGPSLNDEKKLPALLRAHRDRLAHDSHEDAVIAAIDRDRLKAIIEQIEDKDKRLVLLLAVIGGDNGVDAAEAAGVKPGTARKWIRIFRSRHEIDDHAA